MKNNQQEARKIRSETIKNYAQVVAVVVAAAWTAVIFYQREWPSLESRALANGAITWDNAGSTKSCRAIFETSLENTGTTAFNISRVHVRGWRFLRTKLGDRFAVDLEPNDLIGKETHFTDRWYTDNDQDSDPDALVPFVQHYAPGEKYHHSFEWDVQQKEDYWVYFRADFYTSDGDARPRWLTGSWSAVCGGRPDEKHQARELK